MANPFQDILNKILPQEEEKPVVPSQVPFASYPDMTQAELEVPAESFSAVPSRSIAATPQAAQVTSPAPEKPAAPEAAPQESSVQRLERLMSEMKGNRAKEIEDAQSRQLKANVIKGITENLGNVVAGAQAVNTRASVNPRQVKGFDVGDLVSQVDKKYKPEQEQLLAEYKTLQGANKPMTEYQRLMLAHMGKQLEQSSLNSDRAMERFGKGETRRWDNQDFNQAQKDELSDKQLAADTDIENTLAEIDRTTANAANFKDKLGPNIAEIEKAKEGKLGVLVPGKIDPEYVKFRADAKALKGAYQKVISGLTVSDAERKELDSYIPHEGQPYETFVANAQAFKRRVADLKKKTNQGLAKQGKTGISPSMSPQDQKALDWANANSSDPRAAKIFKRLGK